MAFDVKTFRTRSITAIVFTIIMLCGLLLNLWVFLVVFLIIHFGCWQEFLGLLKQISPNNFKKYLLLGLLYISAPILMFADLRLTYINGSDGDINMLKVIPCGIFFSIWINDTMAYIVGSFIGKTPMSTISPKKTWEGTIGGALLCIVVISTIGYFTHLYSLSTWITISGCAAVFGTLGDLLESKLKRMAGVKDSGNLMPGHGGFLDRFDSFLITTPFVWLFVQIFLRH